MIFSNLNKTIICLILACIIVLKNVSANDPYDNDLSGKQLICFADSDSIDGIGLICTCLWRKQRNSGRYLDDTNLVSSLFFLQSFDE